MADLKQMINDRLAALTQFCIAPRMDDIGLNSPVPYYAYGSAGASTSVAITNSLTLCTQLYDLELDTAPMIDALNDFWCARAWDATSSLAPYSCLASDLLAAARASLLMPGLLVPRCCNFLAPHPLRALAGARTPSPASSTTPSTHSEV